MSELQIYDLEYINQMTLTEFNYRMHANEFIQLKREFERYKLAFAIRDAAATKNVGTEKEPKEEYIFKSPNDVLDYEENYKRIKEGKAIRFASEREDYEPNAALYDLIAEFNSK
jgi:hypothetical protein